MLEIELLATRIEKLETSSAGYEVIFSVKEHLTWAEREAFAEDHRRANRLPPDACIIVFDAADARL